MGADMDALAPDSACPPTVLMRFLEMTYGERAAEAAERRIGYANGRETNDVKKAWVEVRELLRRREHA